MHQFLKFIIADGSLLIGLFYGVTFLIFIAGQTAFAKLRSTLSSPHLGLGCLYASLFGAITPFCSCSTIPILVGLLKTNVRFGAGISFLVASPLINEIVVIILIKLFGIQYALSFVFLALVFPIIIGVLTDLLGFKKYLRDDALTVPSVEGFVQPPHEQKISWAAKLKFSHLCSMRELKTSLPYIVIGLLVGGLIYGFVPQDWILVLNKNIPPIVQIPLFALIGAPLYFNMISVLPIAYALVEKGVGIGPITAFLIAGAGTSVPEMILLLRTFKIPLLVWYVFSVVLSAIAIGYIFYFVNFL